MAPRLFVAGDRGVCVAAHRARGRGSPVRAAVALTRLCRAHRRCDRSRPRAVSGADHPRRRAGGCRGRIARHQYLRWTRRRGSRDAGRAPRGTSTDHRVRQSARDLRWCPPRARHRDDRHDQRRHDRRSHARRRRRRRAPGCRRKGRVLPAKGVRGDGRASRSPRPVRGGHGGRRRGDPRRRAQGQAPDSHHVGSDAPSRCGLQGRHPGGGPRRGRFGRC